jgi:hypothetical protein
MSVDFTFVEFPLISSYFAGPPGVGFTPHVITVQAGEV